MGVWVALENIDAENGPLVYYPGSHKLPYFSMQDLGLGPGYSNYHAYELRIQDLIAEHGLQSELGLLEKGKRLSGMRICCMVVPPGKMSRAAGTHR